MTIKKDSGKLGIKGQFYQPNFSPSPMHKNTKLLPIQREAIYQKWLAGNKIVPLARHYEVSRQTIYKVIKRAKLKDFFNHLSINLRWRNITYGLRRLAKTERMLAIKLAKLERRNNRYQKTYPGEFVHLDSKILPHFQGEDTKIFKREHLFVAIDDYSRTLFADILPDKTNYAGGLFLEETIGFFPNSITTIYSDNGGEFRGNKDHQVTKVCKQHGINQQFTKPRTPRTNGKAERVIKTLINEWLKKHHFNTKEERKQSLIQFVNYYNQKRRHQGINNITPFEKLHSYFSKPQFQLSPFKLSTTLAKCTVERRRFCKRSPVSLMELNNKRLAQSRR